MSRPRCLDCNAELTWGLERKRGEYTFCILCGQDHLRFLSVGRLHVLNTGGIRLLDLRSKQGTFSIRKSIVMRSGLEAFTKSEARAYILRMRDALLSRGNINPAEINVYDTFNQEYSRHGFMLSGPRPKNGPTYCQVLYGYQVGETI